MLLQDSGSGREAENVEEWAEISPHQIYEIVVDYFFHPRRCIGQKEYKICLDVRHSRRSLNTGLSWEDGKIAETLEISPEILRTCSVAAIVEVLTLFVSASGGEAKKIV